MTPYHELSQSDAWYFSLDFDQLLLTVDTIVVLIPGAVAGTRLYLSSR